MNILTRTFEVKKKPFGKFHSQIFAIKMGCCHSTNNVFIVDRFQYSHDLEAWNFFFSPFLFTFFSFHCSHSILYHCVWRQHDSLTPSSWERVSRARRAVSSIVSIFKCLYFVVLLVHKSNQCSNVRSFHEIHVKSLSYTKRKADI